MEYLLHLYLIKKRDHSYSADNVDLQTFKSCLNESRKLHNLSVYFQEFIIFRLYFELRFVHLCFQPCL